MARIVESHFDSFDGIEKEHRELEELLDTSARKPGHQADALEKSEALARRAMRLYLKFRQMRFEWEQDNQILFSNMRVEATRALQREKEQGFRSKQITDADVATMCATMFPDEVRVQEAQRNRASLTEKSLEHLVEMWSSKCRSLGTIVGKGRT
jgi:hypothetical protein